MALSRLIALTSIVSWIIFLTVFSFETTNARARLSYGKSGVNDVIPVERSSSIQDRSMNLVKKFMKLLEDIYFSRNNKQTVRSCSSRPCKANQRCHQKGASHVCEFPWTCKDVKLCRPSYTDGEYWLYSEVLGGHMVKIYCAGMSTEEPLEYISVNEKDNYGFYAGEPTLKDVFKRFRKIRVNIMEGKIMRHDFIFSTSTPQDNSDLPDLPYGRGGACSAEGYFSISLQGTGLKFRNEVEWITDGHIPTITNFQRTIDNNMISANCGGGCARCDPNGELFIAYNQNDGGSTPLPIDDDEEEEDVSEGCGGDDDYDNDDGTSP
ncbi:A disintegrin and metalloproteinase with thrombospondin motifs 9-like [Ruditapes philippinarum]|uniref:A disintegrin and metalloproteinase with thrombospondin motifs 9-like n=1 Tax=Ruditapes philippinarum TaxID=129788 RepID=UPI00295ADD7F|nr:A disintegrin and metalloproteinase with thrombospondin motifs 9-like [Ruditapes philippinarum]